MVLVYVLVRNLRHNRVRELLPSYFLEHRYNGTSFLGENIYEKYLLNISSRFGIICLGEISRFYLFVYFFCSYSFGDSTNRQNLRSCGSISPESVLIFHENFLDIRLDKIEKKNIVSLMSFCNKSNASVVFGVSKITFLGEIENATFRPFP